MQDTLKPGPVNMLEYHALLARRDLFDTIGRLDERFRSFGDHDDLVMTALQTGVVAVCEPSSGVRCHKLYKRKWVTVRLPFNP